MVARKSMVIKKIKFFKLIYIRGFLLFVKSEKSDDVRWKRQTGYVLKEKTKGACGVGRWQVFK